MRPKWETKVEKEGLSFDDVFRVPAKSDVLPNDVDLRVEMPPSLKLTVPIWSAGMDTIT
ncbi:IMP dehydrogenase, partial [Listeria monocytogenes]|uniref:IMP dehydrogenase n=1 Tax=Listeria monocytogenes TaxID=1639 RepID=UPI001968E038